MSQDVDSIIFLLASGMVIGTLLYFLMRSGPGRTWDLLVRWVQELAKELMPPGVDLRKKITPAGWVFTVLFLIILGVLKWYLEAGSRLARTIDTIFEITFSVLFFGLVGYYLLAKVRRGLGDDDDSTKQ